VTANNTPKGGVFVLCFTMDANPGIEIFFTPVAIYILFDRIVIETVNVAAVLTAVNARHCLVCRESDIDIAAGQRFVGIELRRRSSACAAVDTNTKLPV